MTVERSLEKVVQKGGRPGVDNQSVRQVGARKELEIEQLGQELRAGQYRSQPVKRVASPHIPHVLSKGRTRCGLECC
jgi:hypothetical protein